MQCVFPASSSSTSRRFFSVLVLLTTGLTLTLLCAPGQAAEPRSALDLSTPKKAALVFAEAIDAGDMDIVHEAAAGTPEQFTALTHVIQAFAAMRRYEGAAVKKFGPAGKLALPIGLAAGVEAADEKVEGANAMLVTKADSNNKTPMKLAKDGDHWKVDLNSVHPLGYGLDTWFARHRHYTSSGLIEVRTRSEMLLPGDALRPGGLNVAELDIERGTQVKLLLHKGYLSRLLESDEAVRQTQWFKQFAAARDGKPWLDAPAAKADLLARLAVEPEAGTRLICVRFSYSNPKDCQTIVTEIVNQRIKDQRAACDNQDLENMSSLQSLKLNYEAQMHDASNRMTAIAAELGTMGVAVGPGASSKDFELQQLISEQFKARAFDGAAIEKLTIFKRQLESNSAPELEGALEKNPRYNDYRRLVQDLEKLHDELQATLKAEDPKVIAAKVRLNEARKKLTNTEEEIKSRTATLILANLENDTKAAESAVQRIGQRIMEVRQEIAEVATKRNDYMTLEAQRARLRAQFDQIQNQQERLTAANNSRALPIGWAAAADLPDLPESGRRGEAAADQIDAASNNVEAGRYDTAEHALAAMERALASAMKPASSN